MVNPRIRSSFAATSTLLLLAVPAMSADFHAERLDEANLSLRRVRGPDAVSGLGDLAFGNGVLCAVVSDPGHENDLSTTGGTLMDLGFCGRADDQFLAFEQLVNLTLSRLIPVSSVTPERTPEAARVVARGERDGLAIETTYELDAVAPRRLRIHSRLTRVADGDAVFAVGAAFANVYALTRFVTSTGDLPAAPGFSGTAFFGLGAGAASRAAVPSDLVVLVGDDALDPGVSYGALLADAHLERASGEIVPVPRLLLADDLASIFAMFARPFWLGDGRSLGRLELLQTRFMDLSRGDSLAWELDLYVGDRADVASVTDLVFAGSPRVTGKVDDATARLHVDRSSGAVATEIRPAADGAFSAALPPGDYVLRIDAPGSREVRRAFSLSPAGTDLGAIAVGMAARVRLPRGHAMRLVFEGRDGTPDPRFGDDLLGFTLEGKDEIRRTAGVRDLPLGGTSADPDRVVVAPGRYRVRATRGPEYSLTRAEVVARAGETVDLVIDPPARVLETPGWIAADFHVHAAASPDTGLALPVRVASYAAEGGEVLISTDHDMVTDYAPVIRELGLAGEIASVIGIEVTSEVKTDVAPYTTGHANAFPFPRDPSAYRGGAVANEGRRWGRILGELRALPGERIVQLNHARYGSGAYQPRAYFTHLASVGKPYDPTLRLDEGTNAILSEVDPETGYRDIDFDAMELLNGVGLEGYWALRQDWFSLMRQGVVLTGTANSDSHTRGRVVAVPRNYVRVDDDRVAAFDEAAFTEAVRRGRVVGTTGPILDVRLGDAGPGDRYVGRSGTLRVEVRAAPWIPVSELRVLVDGVVVHRAAVSAPASLEIPLEFTSTTFVTVEVEGTPGEDYAAVLPGFVPFAFTNPIFVELD